jgi:hypothetical protein
VITPVKRAVVLAAALGFSVCVAAPGISRADQSVPAAKHSVDLGKAPKGHKSVELSWIPAYMSNSHKYTQAQAVAMARHNALIIGTPNTFSRYTHAMHAANPHLTLLTYTDATFQTGGEVAALPESEFAHDAAGHRIRSRTFPTWLMEPSSAAWRLDATMQCRERAVVAHSDGCFLDMLTMGIFSKGYTTSMPVNPATHAAYTEKAWRAQLVGLAKEYSANDPNLVLVGNAVSNASRYWTMPVSSRPLAMALPAAQTEDFLRSSLAPTGAYPSEKEWRNNVGIVTDMEHSGHTGLYSTKLWSGASRAQVAAWQRYAMATFLMGANGHSFFAFTDSRTAQGAAGTDLPYRMPKSLGAPTGKMRHVHSVFKRSFRGGRVIVNPGASAHRVHLHGHFVDLEGNAVSSMLLPAHSGDVFLGTNRTKQAPKVMITSPHRSATVHGRRVHIRGKITHQHRVRRAFVTIRNRRTDRWLRPNGKFGAHRHLLRAKLHRAPRTGHWSLVVRLPKGHYRIRAIMRVGHHVVIPHHPGRNFRVR